MCIRDRGDEMEEDEDEQQVTDDDEEATSRNSTKQSTDSKATKTRKQGPKNLKKTKK